MSPWKEAGTAAVQQWQLLYWVEEEEVEDMLQARREGTRYCCSASQLVLTPSLTQNVTAQSSEVKMIDELLHEELTIYKMGGLLHQTDPKAREAVAVLWPEKQSHKSQASQIPAGEESNSDIWGFMVRVVVLKEFRSESCAENGR
jgi:hypothetical protein